MPRLSFRRSSKLVLTIRDLFRGKEVSDIVEWVATIESEQPGALATRSVLTLLS
jgi:hypothetical protein